MPAITPFADELNALPPLASRYVDVDALPWRPSGYEGIDIKVLLKDEESGLLTALFRWQPGSVLPLHEHVRIEQTWVLEGSIVDEEGETTVGNFSWRPQQPAPRLCAERGPGAVFLPDPQQVPRGPERRLHAGMTATKPDPRSSCCLNPPFIARGCSRR